MSTPAKRWSLAVHGGAKEIGADEEADNRAGVRRALQAGRLILDSGGSAVAAVEAAVRVLEDDPAFNAGYGSALNASGAVEMCAAVMSGRDLSIGAVGVIPGVRHPVSVARLLLAEPEILLAGPSARDFAEAKGAELCDPAALIVPAQREALKEACDTVGAVALDTNGDVAAATSTGGLPGVRAGRMGDSALPGCGYYADNAVGAVALSGDGEAIARLTVAARIMASMRREPPEAALRMGLAPVAGLGGDGGGIAVCKDGRISWWHNSPAFAVGVASSADPHGGVRLGRGTARS
jgi:beta-aspartyl-peptidase (threonine type)